MNALSAPRPASAMRRRSALLPICSLLTAALLSGCSRNPASSDEATRQSEAAAKAQAESDSAAAAMLLPAYRLNREASSHARLAAMKADAGQPDLRPSLSLPALGPVPAVGSAALAPRPQPAIASALLKRPALGKSAAGAADSSWIAYGDTARGRVLRVHAYARTEDGISVLARDTLVCAWPYDSANPTVLLHSGGREYADGMRAAYAISDEDGDGTLNEAVGGSRVKLRKVWTAARGDTAWKSLHHTVHGFTGVYDTIGAGLDTGWTDSVFVAGRTVSWQRYMDGDKDGFVLTAAAGQKPRISRDAYVELGGGVFRLDHESFGPGADGDFLEAADNERYPYSSQTIDSSGRGLVDTRYGDGDGDGYYFDPAASGGNRAWIANRYPAEGAAKAWSDSLTQVLSGPGGAEARITSYSSVREYPDGSRRIVSSRAPGRDAFGSGDTAQIRELWDYSGKAPAGDLDSSLTVTWMIPGSLGDVSDDKVVRVYARQWAKAGAATASVSELIAADAPFSPGQAPASGTWTREESRSPVSSKSIIRSVLYKEFGGAGGRADWRRTDYFESGDSAVSQGSGNGTYAQVLGPGARSTGRYDPQTGSFADTTLFPGPKGETGYGDVAWGAIDPATGACDYRVKRAGSPDSTAIRVKAAAEGGGLALMRIAGSDTLRLRLIGDSAISTLVSGGVKREYSWKTAAGAHRVAQMDVDAGTGTILAEGEYYFGQDLSGNGTVKKTPPGKPASEAKVVFQSDGSIFQDGVRVFP